MNKDFSNYTRSKNNPNLWVDTQPFDDAIALTDQKIRSRAQDPCLVVMAYYKEKIFSETILEYIQDFHAGAEGCEVEKYEGALHYTDNVVNALLSFGGDLADIGTLDNHGGAQTAREKIEESRNWVIHSVKKYGKKLQKKILGSVGGNHDYYTGNRNKNNSANHTKHIADAIGIPTFPYGVLYNIELPLPNGKGTRIAKVFHFHCSGRSSTTKAADDTFRKAMSILASKGEVPDLIVGAHFHAGTSKYEMTLNEKRDKYGDTIAITKKVIPVFSTLSLQSTSTYSAAAGLSKKPTNVLATKIKWKENPLYKLDSKAYDKYVLDVCPFYIYKNNYDYSKKPEENYSAPAKAILEKYHEPNITPILEEKYNKTQAKDIIKEIEETKILPFEKAKEEVM